VAVIDDGIGLPPGFDPGRAASMGWQLVSTLVQQLKARLEIDKGDVGGPGARVRFSFFPAGYPRIDRA
jgi:two-component sensor histidine kinase